MRVRTHLIIVALVCALGTIAVMGTVYQRSQSLKSSSVELERAMVSQYEIGRFSDLVKQLFVSADLLFGAAETYMFQPTKRQIQAASQQRDTLASHFDSGTPEQAALSVIREDLAALRAEVNAFEQSANAYDLNVSNEQLKRVDELTANMVSTINSLKMASTALLIRLHTSQDEIHDGYGGFVWLFGLGNICLVFLAIWWAARSISNPLNLLALSARESLANGAEFAAISAGPTEVRDLASQVDQFVQSLQAEIGQRSALINSIPDTVIVANSSHQVTFVKPGLDTPKAMASMKVDMLEIGGLLGERQLTNFVSELEQCMATQQPRQFEVVLEESDDRRSYEVRASAASADEVVVLIRDLTEKVEAENRVRHLAYHDGLTGLLNRRAFKQSVEDQVASFPGNKFALLFFDIDRFKSINDVHGHGAGDSILVHIGRCLEDNTRNTDLIGGSVSARIGGDEFMVMLRDTQRVDEVVNTASRLLREISRPTHFDNASLSATVSIGVSMFPEHGRTIDQLMNNADLAMFAAKRSGGNQYQVYEHSMGAVNLRRLSMEEKLKRAIDEEKLYLVYQPKIELASNRIVGAEALLRWQDGDTAISPAEFVPIAEESGLIIPMGEQVLNMATMQLAAWRDAGHQLEHVAVNVAASQFRHEGVLEQIQHAVKSANLNCSDLGIEITESLFIEEFDRSLKTLNALNELGFQIAMDDFGTGYSSLSYLKRIPLHTLKIDRSFVSGITEDSKEKVIVRAIVQLGHTLGLELVAEGVETEQQANYLREIGCDVVQGYYYSPPLSATYFEEYLATTQGSLTAINDAASFGG